MKTVRPKPMGAPMSGLPLTPEEGFVLSRIDGRLSVKDLVALTGLEENRVEQIVTKLASHGAIQLEGAESTQQLPDAGSDPRLPAAQGTTSLADFAAVLGMDPSAFAAAGAPAAVETPVAEDRVESRSNHPPPAVSEPEPAADASPEEEIPTLDPDLHGVADEPAAPAEETAGEEPSEATSAAAERNYRQLYQEKFHPMTTDARVQAAKTAQGAELFALCLDPDARIIAAIMENHGCGLDHVRMMAFHHRTGTGLEMISRRQDWLRDQLVERRLLRNPQTPETVLARVMSSKQLLQTYKIMVDREVPELTRTRVRGHFRKKWTTAAPEDRADLVMRTEGRPLIYMTGCTFDARTTQIICGKTLASMLMIQNFAKFPATPPGILAHCMKQPFVRKNPGIRKLLLQHPNMPGEVKRSM